MIDCRNYALKLIEIRDRTRKEMTDKLTQKGYDEDTVEKELAFLSEYSYIDDNRYATRFTNDAISLKKWGKGRIRAELLHKGIAREIVDVVLEEAFSNLDEDRLYTIMEKRFKNSDLSNIKERTRIFNYYLRRGYSPDEIKGAINRLCSFSDIITDEI